MSLIYSDKSKGKIDSGKYKSYLYIHFFYPDSKKTNYGGYFGLSYNNLNFPSNNFIKGIKIKSVINSQYGV